MCEKALQSTNSLTFVFLVNPVKTFSDFCGGYQFAKNENKPPDHVLMYCKVHGQRTAELSG